MFTNEKVVQFRGTVYELGSGMVAQKVMRDTNLSRDAKALYAYLCSFAWGNTDNERSAFPSVSLQCHELGIKTEKSYYRYRKELLMSGYITIEKSRSGKGKFMNNVYFIEAVPTPKTEEEVKEILQNLNKRNDIKESNPHGKKDRMDIIHTVKKPCMVKTKLGLNPSWKKEGTNKNSILIKTEFKQKQYKENHHHQEKEEKVVQNKGKDITENMVVEIQSLIQNHFYTKLNQTEISRLMIQATKLGKDLAAVIIQTKEHFLATRESIRDLVATLMHGINVGWDKPKNAYVGHALLPRSIRMQDELDALGRNIDPEVFEEILKKYGYA